MNFLGQDLFRKHIVVLPNQLTPQFCQHVIDKFEKSPHVVRGRTAGGHDVRVKQSTDLGISRYEEWEWEDKIFAEAISNALQKYDKIMEKSMKRMGNYTYGFDTGYQLQRTSPGGFYDWHNDACDTRYLTFIFYLNDIKKGGYTEFCNGTRVKPKTGSLLIWPATHQYVHRGVAPVDEIKYIATGWVHTELTDDERILHTSERYQAMDQRLADLESQLPENNQDPEHIGGHTPPDGDIATSYGHS